MDDRLIPSQTEMVEGALRSYPVAPLPNSITADVVARIQHTPAPRFRLSRSDILLAIVLTVVFSSIVFSLQFLPAHILLQIRIQGILLWQSLLINMRWLLPAVFFGMASLLAALTIPTLYRMTIDHGR